LAELRLHLSKVGVGGGEVSTVGSSSKAESVKSQEEISQIQIQMPTTYVLIEIAPSRLGIGPPTIKKPIHPASASTAPVNFDITSGNWSMALKIRYQQALRDF
jgi:hypothetical protein